jgi:hypothetical protein
MTEVPVVVHELLSALGGRPIVVRTLDGRNVLLRLATPDEVEQFQREARAALATKGIDVNLPLMSRAEAEAMCRPITLGLQR